MAVHFLVYCRGIWYHIYCPLAELIHIVWLSWMMPPSCGWYSSDDSECWSILFLPPRSPDYNPIEEAFSKVKLLIKSYEMDPSMEHLELDVLAAFCKITSDDCKTGFTTVKFIIIKCIITILRCCVNVQVFIVFIDFACFCFSVLAFSKNSEPAFSVLQILHLWARSVQEAAAALSSCSFLIRSSVTLPGERPIGLLDWLDVSLELMGVSGEITCDVVIAFTTELAITSLSASFFSFLGSLSSNAGRGGCLSLSSQLPVVITRAQRRSLGKGYVVPCLSSQTWSHPLLIHVT